MRRIITLTGPSMAGKSTAIDYFLSTKIKGYEPICIPKYNTRKKRNDDREFEVISCDKLPPICDLVYQQYDVRYGLNSFEIIKKLTQNNTCIIVLNDVRTISEIKRIFGELCVSIFVYRKSPSVEQFKLRSEINDSEINLRLKKAESIYRIYIENIELFDHVLINSFGKSELKKQIKSIVKMVTDDKQHLFK